MKKTATKNPTFLTSLYGLSRWDVIPCMYPSKTGISVDDGWFRLRLGTDTGGVEFLAVFTQDDSFVLSTLTTTSAPRRNRKKRTPWVFEIDELPSKFCGTNPSKTVTYGDFKISYGIDASQRDFLSVFLPKQKLTYLFRNPTFLSTEPWNKHKAIPIAEGMTIVATPRAKTALDLPAGTGNCSDADLNAMLAALC